MIEGDIKVGDRIFIPYWVVFPNNQIGKPDTNQYLKIQIYQTIEREVIITLKHFEYGGDKLMNKVYFKIFTHEIQKHGVRVMKPIKEETFK